ncbi:MAG: CTP synthase [Caldisericum sp.]
MKVVFITGGVISSLGKGLVASSLGMLLESRGFSVNIAKIDPYLQIDAGTMSPYEHGEVFVTEDGGETDLDIGNYERFLNKNLTKDNSLTTGKIYYSVLTKERLGYYLGKTVQVIPHITNEIKDNLKKLGSTSDILMVEIGGTVGDIESQPFLEAARQMKNDLGKENVSYIHVSLLPYLRATQEVKTKPTQHSVKELRSMGIQPDLLVLRSEVPVQKSIKEKLSLFTDVKVENVLEAIDADNIYKIPILLEKQEFSKRVLAVLGLQENKLNIDKYLDFLQRMENPQKTVKIGIVGKYVELKDAYKSLIEALKHGATENRARLEIVWINSETLENENYKDTLEEANLDGILVPGGFGVRGIEGMINAIRYARENKTPFLGICLGMQLMTVEFARNVCGLREANSTEFDPKTPYPVIDIMESQKDLKALGGTMRLGAQKAILKEGSLAFRIYGTTEISERHRHRYEVNNEFLPILTSHGFVVSGTSPNGKLVEFGEIEDHPFFIGTQAHPEFKSRPLNPHPLFVKFIEASINHKP